MIAATAPLRGHDLTCTNNPTVTNYRRRNYESKPSRITIVVKLQAE